MKYKRSTWHNNGLERVICFRLSGGDDAHSTAGTEEAVQTKTEIPKKRRFLAKHLTRLLPIPQNQPQHLPQHTHPLPSQPRLSSAGSSDGCARSCNAPLGLFSDHWTLLR